MLVSQLLFPAIVCDDTSAKKSQSWPILNKLANARISKEELAFITWYIPKFDSVDANLRELVVDSRGIRRVVARVVAGEPLTEIYFLEQQRLPGRWAAHIAAVGVRDSAVAFIEEEVAPSSNGLISFSVEGDLLKVKSKTNWIERVNEFSYRVRKDGLQVESSEIRLPASGEQIEPIATKLKPIPREAARFIVEMHAEKKSPR
ncbi:MAG: hypothetical protein AAF802_23885 [Planctomycetota bacterium]